MNTLASDPRLQLRESEARNSLLLGSVAQAVWETDAAGVVVTDSPSWRAYTGQTLEQWLGYGWLDAVHPDDRAYAERQWREAVAARGLVDAEFRLRAPDGGWRWTNVRAVPVLDAHGNIEKWAGMNIDIDAGKYTEAALRDSEAKFRSLFESIDEGVCIMEAVRDGSGRVVDVIYRQANRAWERQIGFAVELGRKASELFSYDPAEAPWIETWNHVLDTGESVRQEQYIGESDRWYNVQFARIGAAGSDLIAAVFDDITERKRGEALLRDSEERQAFLLRLTDAVRSEANERAVIERALPMLAEELTLDRCYVTRIYPAADLTEVVHEVRSPDLAPMPPSLRNSDFPEAFRQTFDRTLVFDDMASDPALTDADKTALSAMEFGALLSRPLRKDDSPIFAVGAVSSRPRHWMTSEISLVEDAAERIWAAVERARAEAALRESEEKFRTLFEGLDEGLSIQELIFDDAGRVIDWIYREANSAFESQGGLPNPYGKRGSEVVPHLDQQVLDLMDRVARTGQPERSESHITDIDRHIRFQTSRVGGAGSRLLAVVFEDVTDQRRAETVLRESEERQAFLLRLSDALSPLEDATAIPAEASRILRERLDADRVAYAELDADEDTARPLAEVCAVDVPALAQASYRWSDFDPTGREAARAGRSVARADVETADEVTPQQRAVFAAVGFRAFINVPIIKGERLVAFIAVHFTQPRSISAEEVSLVEATAERTWAAVERARAETALRDSEQRFRALLNAGVYTIYRMSPDWRLMYQLDSNALATTVAPIEDWVEKYIPETDLPAVRAAIAEAIRTKSMFELEHRVRQADGSIAWVLSRAVPLLNDSGEITEWFGAGSDVTARRVADDRLRDSEERYRSLFESMDEAYAVVEVLKDDAGQWCDFRFLAVNPAFMVHTGMPYPVRQTATELLGTPNPRWTELYGRALDTGEPLRVEEGEATLGKVFDLNIFAVDRGQHRVAVLFTNITERKQAEQALRDSEQRQRLMVELVPALLWSASPDGRDISLNEGWSAYTGQSEAETQDYGWLDAVHPDDLPATRAAFAHAFATGEPIEREHRIHKAGNGYRWHLVRHVPVRDDHGSIVRWFGAAIDVHELHELQISQQTLVAELQHRVRNILAIIRSIMRRSLDGEQSLQDYAQHLEGRMDALARTQVLLTRQVNARVNLEDLIRDELLAQACSEDRVELRGPDVALSPQAAEVLGLAAHELATNAVKYGAIGHPGGNLTVEWEIEERDGEQWLKFVWSERGVPVSAGPPQRSGFGTELITRRVPYELKGQGDLEMKFGGVVCTITFPLRDGSSVLETGAVVSLHGVSE